MSGCELPLVFIGIANITIRMQPQWVETEKAYSTVSRLDQAFHAPPAGGGLAGDQGALQPETNVDGGMCSYTVSSCHKDSFGH
jgi:hypothetical protein